MFIKRQRRANGRVYLSIVEGYRQNGLTRLRHIKSLGYLDEIERTHGDVDAYCRDELAALKATSVEKTIRLSDRSPIALDGPRPIELGPIAVLWCLYRMLDLDTCLEGVRGGSAAINTLAYLVWNRLAHPDLDIRGDEEPETAFPVRIDRSSHAICKSLRTLLKRLDTIRSWIRDASIRVLAHIDENPSIKFMRYGIASYFIEQRHVDFSARSAAQPLVHLGLLSSPQGLPLGYAVSANASRKDLLSAETLNRYAEEYPEIPLFVTAEGGRHYEQDMARCAACGASFLFSLPLTGESSAHARWVMDPQDYEGNDYVKLKTRRIVQRFSDPYDISLQIKEIAYWNRRLERRFRRDSAELSDEVYRSIEYGTGLNFTRLLYNVLDYSAVKNIDKQGRRLDIDWGKVELSEITAGYRCLVTDLIGHDDNLLIDAYQGIWRVQNNFRVLAWEHGSIYEHLTREEFINAHFFIAFIATYVSLALRLRTGWRYSSYDVSSALRQLVGHSLGADTYLFDYRSAVTDDIAHTTGLDFSRKIMSGDEIRELARQAMRPRMCTTPEL